MSEAAIPVGHTALVVVDLQNDFLHPDGAYGRAGQGASEIAALPARLKPLADRLRANGGLVVSTHFTLVPVRGAPLVSPHLRALRRSEEHTSELQSRQYL